MSVLDRLAVAEVKLNRVSEASYSHTAQLAAMISDVSELMKAVPPLSLPSYSSMVASGPSCQVDSAVQKPKPLSCVSLKAACIQNCYDKCCHSVSHRVDISQHYDKLGDIMGSASEHIPHTFKPNEITRVP